MTLRSGLGRPGSLLWRGAIFALALFNACSAAGGGIASVPGQPEAVRPPPLLETTWSLQRLEGLETLEAALADGAMRPSLELDAQGQASGSAGCNRWFGSYELEEGRLGFGRVGATRRMCASPAMAVEERFLAALAKVVSYQIEDHRLLLRDRDGALLLEMTPAPEQALQIRPR